MDGTALARRTVEKTGGRAAELTGRTGTAPCFATVLVGEDPTSVTYVRMKQNRCRKAGICWNRPWTLPPGNSVSPGCDQRSGVAGGVSVS